MIAAIITAVAALWVLGLTVLIVAARRAPLGVEDEDGFRSVEQRPRPEPVIGTPFRLH